MKIVLQTIPHSAQRYPTVGDWQIGSDGSITILVSDLGDEDLNFLVALHELIEVKLCQKRDVTQEKVDVFDMAYEKTRPEGDNSEPGDHPESPYRDEHCFATGIERLMASALEVCWENYASSVESL